MEVRLNIPTATVQLSQKQLRFVSRLWVAGYSTNEFLLKAFLYLSGLKLDTRKKPDATGWWFKHPSRKQPFVIETDLLNTMAGQCRYLLSMGEVQPLKWIRGARSRHFRLFDATLDEYLMAENYFFAYVETKREEHLDNLISVLYRRPWQRWNPAKIQQRAKKFKNVDPEVKNAVFMWYIGFRSFVPKRCPSLFTGKKGSGKGNIRNYVNGIIHQLTAGDITRKRALMKQPAWDALDELEQRAYESLEAEKRIKSKQKK